MAQFSIFVLVVLALAGAAWAFARFYMREPVKPARPVRTSRPPVARSQSRSTPTIVHSASTPARGTHPSTARKVTTSSGVALDTIEWDGPMPVRAPSLDPTQTDPGRLAVRDKYVQARFAGVFSRASELSNAANVLKAARLYYEDGKYDRPQELLALAIQLSPHEKVLPLARLELCFLARDASLFIELARAWREARPQSAEWPEICRLGRALSPGEPLFDNVDGSRADGRWPDAPNWMQASWNLTPDVLAADFHRAISRG